MRKGESVSGYVLEGPKWSSNTVTWNFATQTYPVDSAVPFSSAITQSAYQSVVEAAIERWESISGVTFERVADSQSVDVRIGFGDFPTDSSEIGETDYLTTAPADGSNDGTSFEPDTIVRLDDPSADQVVGVAGQYQYAGTETDLYQVILHELGHSLGLGHDADVYSVMYPTATADNRDLWRPRAIRDRC
jgi:predicted Zn-dependent protease